MVPNAGVVIWQAVLVREKSPKSDARFAEYGSVFTKTEQIAVFRAGLDKQDYA